VLGYYQKRKKRLSMSQQNNSESSKALAMVNATTGEILVPDEDVSTDNIIPYNVLSGLLDTYRHEVWPGVNMPVHLAALEAMALTDDQRLALEEAYNSSDTITMKAFVAKYANLDVRVWGITIYEHGPYMSKPPDSRMMPGFYQPRLLIEVPNGELVIVRTGSQYLAEHIFYILRKHGWWLFNEPITYRFNAGESGALFMTHVYKDGENLKKRLSRKVKGDA
jgi:hypothetical protein